MSQYKPTFRPSNPRPGSAAYLWTLVDHLLCSSSMRVGLTLTDELSLSGSDYVRLSRHGSLGTSEELGNAHNAKSCGLERAMLILFFLSCLAGRAFSACPTAGSSWATVNIQAGETCTLSPGNYSLSGLTVSGTLVLETAEPSIVRITVTGTLDVRSSGRISSDGRGYIHDSGPGAGSGTSGGGHGGRGGHPSGSFLTSSQSQPYGNATEPVLSGSGGGGAQGGAGGGVVHITAQTITVNGPISANGQDATGGNGGGGSGGVDRSRTVQPGVGTVRTRELDRAGPELHVYGGVRERTWFWK
ncbi:hypothetical protein Bbelb_408080 [Branchiostoma belcheri]|nr:hypothetical protein Bbelb_408080 [Branchiostoma belcheri]